MTIHKANSPNLALAPKQLPQKAAQHCNISKSHTAIAKESNVFADILLQSTNTRRKYMRRGSKTPALLIAAMTHIGKPDHLTAIERMSEAKGPKKLAPITARRLSIMSLLSVSLQQGVVLDATSPATTSHPLRPLKLERKRSVPSSE